MFFKIFCPRTRLAKLLKVRAQLRIIFGDLFLVWKPELASTIFPVIQVTS